MQRKWEERDKPLEKELQKTGLCFVRFLGGGTFGRVDLYKNYTGEEFAVKTVSLGLSPGRDKCCLREIGLLGMLSPHPNINPLLDIIPHLNLKKVSLILKKNDFDLCKFLLDPQVIDAQQIAWLTYQLLSALKYLKDGKIIHRDLKPENIFLMLKGQLQVGDFGGSILTEEPELAEPSIKEKKGSATEHKASDPTPKAGHRRKLSLYVVSRWWRAPEILFDSSYDFASDMWSLAINVLELLVKAAGYKNESMKFLRGRDYLHQIQMIIEFLGTPSEEDLTFIDDKKAYEYVRQTYLDPKKKKVGTFQQLRTDLINAMNELNKKPERKKLDMTLIGHAFDLLEKLLKFNPKKRISVEEALQHPLVKHLSETYEPAKPSFHKTAVFARILSQLEEGELTQEKFDSCFSAMVTAFKSNKAKSDTLTTTATLFSSLYGGEMPDAAPNPPDAKAPLGVVSLISMPVIPSVSIDLRSAPPVPADLAEPDAAPSPEVELPPIVRHRKGFLLASEPAG